MKVQVCRVCKELKSIGDFYFRNDTKKHETRCKTCANEANKKNEQNRDKEYTAARTRYHNKQLRLKVLERYGNCCQCCGENRYEFLAMDHINNDGAEHRNNGTYGGQATVKWIIDNDYPQDFQILCHNCNAAKGYYGMCPHERERQGLPDPIDSFEYRTPRRKHK